MRVVNLARLQTQLHRLSGVPGTWGGAAAAYQGLHQRTVCHQELWDEVDVVVSAPAELGLVWLCVLVEVRKHLTTCTPTPTPTKGTAGTAGRRGRAEEAGAGDAGAEGGAEGG